MAWWIPSARSAWRSGFVAVCLVALLAPGLAWGGSKAKAKVLFKEGQKAYDLGRFDEALQDYTAAYDAAPLPGFLFNIAQCHRQLGHLDQAAFFYSRFISMAGDSPAVETAQKLLADVEAKRSELQKQKQEAADAARQEQLEQAKAAAARAEAEAAEKKSELEAQKRTDLRAAAEASAAKSAAQPEVAAQPVAEPSKPLVERWWFWTAIGAAAVGATAAVYVATLPRAPDGSLGTIDARH